MGFLAPRVPRLPPPPPPPPTQADASVLQAQERRRRGATNTRRDTLLTGATGLTGGRTTGLRTLLGQ